MTTWVLLRGLTREARHWGDLPGRLAFRLGGAPVATVDLPGSGTRHGERSPTSVAALVASCREVLQASGIAPPYGLFGLSLGGMVAIEWAARHRGELAGLVLVNTSSANASPWHGRLRWQRLSQLLGIVLAPTLEARERRVLRLTTRHPPEPEADIVARWATFRRERPVSAGNALRQLVAAARFRAPVQAPSLPVLVLASAADALVDPACSAALARAWGARLRVHPTAGHDLPLDDAGWVAEEVARWWRSHAPRGPGPAATAAAAGAAAGQAKAGSASRSGAARSSLR